jgi:ankyrin repeat protein
MAAPEDITPEFNKATANVKAKQEPAENGAAANAVDLNKLISKGTLNNLKKLINQGTVNQKNNKGMTPLHYAAREGRLDMVKALINANVKIDEVNQRGQTALHLAAKNGRTEVVKLLLGADAKVDLEDTDKLTPFQVASNNEIKYLLWKEKGAPTTLSNDNKQALLNQAIKNNKINYVKSLIADGAKVNSVPTNIGNGNLKKYLERTIAQQENSKKPGLSSIYGNTNETLKKYLRTLEGRQALRRSYKRQKRNNNNNSIGSVFNLLKRSEKLTNISLNNLSTEYTQKSNLYNEGNERRTELKQAAANANAAVNAKAAANKAAAEKAAKNKEAAEKINSIKGGNFNKLKNISLTNLTDAELKGILQTLSVKGTTDEHKEMMKKLLKIWIEKGKTVNSAEISKNSPFIKSLNADIKKITNNYALRQKFTSTSSTLGITSNTPNTIKKALLTQNGREGIIKSYGLGIPAISPIPEIVSALHKRGSFKNSITLNSLKKEYQNLREAFPNNKNINAAITSISLITNANMRAKINQLKQNIPNELLSGNAKIGLILKSNGSPYKLVNYTKINQSIKNFKATGKNQNLNNSDIITKAANGTWSLVEVSKNLLKQ